MIYASFPKPFPRKNISLDILSNTPDVLLFFPHLSITQKIFFNAVVKHELCYIKPTYKRDILYDTGLYLGT